MQIDVAQIPKIAKITKKTLEVCKENERRRRPSTRRELYHPTNIANVTSLFTGSQITEIYCEQTMQI